MQRAIVALILLSAGCRFHLDALPGGPTTSPDDLAVGSDVDFAAGGDDDMAGSVDLAAPAGVDMTVDPCANPPALGSGNLAAQCVVGKPPVLDGNLADWPTSGFVPVTHTTAAISGGQWQNDPTQDDPDCSARMAWAWDLQYFYVAVAVTDDIRGEASATLYQDDAVELYLDGQHDRTVTYGSDDWELIFTADARTMALQTGSTVTFPTGVKQAIATGPGAAWAIEVAIPWSILGGAAPSLGRLIGFDYQADDNDGGTMLARWLDAYYTAAPGGPCQAPYCRTDAFATVQLQGR